MSVIPASPEPADDPTKVAGRLDALADQVASLTAAVDAQAAQLAALGMVGAQLAELVPKVRALLDSRPARAIAAWRRPPDA